MYSPRKRRESERESSMSYFSTFSPRSRTGSTLGVGLDYGSPLTRSSPLSAIDGNSRETTTSQHPLALELQSLRTSLAKFQHVAHKTSMQLQGKAMEVVMMQDEAGRLRDENRVLKEELEVLRAAGPSAGLSLSGSGQDSAIALSELSLAHRRLCAKMDASEESLHQANLSLSEAHLEKERLEQEVREMQSLGGQWRNRIEEERATVERERLERRRVEEELRICKLALAEYENQGPIPSSVQEGGAPKSETTTANGDLEPNAGICPSRATPLTHPQSFADGDSVAPPNSSTHLASTPSNILLGIQGLQRLFAEFQTALVEKEGRIAQLENQADIRSAELQTERELVQKAVTEKEEMRRDLNAVKADDESASKVVERYMAFTQKTTQQQHTNFQASTTRLNQTINTLRHQLLSGQTLLDRETARTAQLRLAIDELAEGFERETVGRRREVALRMKGLEREDRRLEAGRRWAERVRRERSRLGGVAEAGGTLTVGGRSVGMSRSASPMTSPSKAKPNNLLRASPSSTSLASMNSNALNPYEENRHLSTLWDLLESGIELFAEDEGGALVGISTANGDRHHLDDQSAREMLIRDLHDDLVRELEQITQKNVSLERQRLEWLATGAIDLESVTNVVAKNIMTLSPDKVLPALPPQVDPSLIQASQALHGGLQLDIAGESALPNGSAADTLLDETLGPLLQRLQNTIGRFNKLQKQLADCAASVSILRDVEADIAPAYSSTLQILLDGISDVIEDVRVEVEIAIADDQRDLEGHRTVLKLRSEPAVVAKASDFADPSHIAIKAANFAKRLRDVEHDLIGIKTAVSELQAEGTKTVSSATTEQEVVNPLLGIALKTIRAPTPPSRASMQQRAICNGLKRGFFGGLGRTLSGTTPVLPLSRASSVSQHSPMAEHGPGPHTSHDPAVQQTGVNESGIDDVE